MRLFKVLHLAGLLFFGIVLLHRSQVVKAAWHNDWVDYVIGDLGDEIVSVNTLSLKEIGEMRVRDIKRRLTRAHGYSADELGRMLDKKELINTLAFEEHKTRERELEKQKRILLKRGLIAALLAVSIVMLWPLLSHAYEVAAVNFVVYTDRKRLEARRCFELQSFPGFIGVMLMFIVDGLQLWLSASIILSWVMTSKYFFPVPRLPIHPAQLMGGAIASGPLGKYGFNLGPMAISWGFRYLNGTIEKWTGRVLANAQREQRRMNRDNETQQEKAERKVRKAARKAAREAARQQASAASSQRAPNQGQLNNISASIEQPVFPQEKEPPTYDVSSVEKFLGQDFDAQQDESDDISEDHEPSSLEELD